MTCASHFNLFNAKILVLVFVFCACTSVQVQAQVAGGTISGTIRDSRGKEIPTARVSIRNVATDLVRNVDSNSEGYYIAPNLLPATYEITVSAQGFNTSVIKAVELTVGAQQTLDLVMRVGTIMTTVQVTTEAPTVQLSTSDISEVVNANTVRELPLNGRSWTDLATLQPGVNAIRTQVSFTSGDDRGNRGFGQQLTISGARPQQNNYRLDGISLNDYANGAPGSVLGGNLGVDAIQEFSVLTSNYSAEYGKTSGGVVNATTRAGTNNFHGSAYEFLRNSALDARDFFDGTKPPYKRNQFGGAVGGPILKKRTFFFADYEGDREAKGITQVDFVPTLQARLGQLSTGPVTVDLSAQKYLALYPQPNGPVTADPDVAEFRFAGNQVVHENFVTTRIDHKFSDNNTLFGTYMFDRTPYNSPDSLDNVELRTLTSRQIVALEETHAFSASLVNAVRFGYNHEAAASNQGVSAINPAAVDTTLGVFAGQHGAQVNIGSLSSMPGGVWGLPTYRYGWNSFQLYDDAFLIKGTHSIKFGGAVERMLLQVTTFSDPNGIWQFNTLSDFLQNIPKRFQGGIITSVKPRDLRQTLVGAYVQDDWRWKPNLTLNLGLRYEMTTVPTEIHGQLANLRPNPVQPSINGLPNFSDPNAHLGDPFFSNPTVKNFEPRVGFAWDPFNNKTMAVRGGFGMFDVLPLPYQFILLTNQATPFFEYTSINAASTPISFFSGLPSPLPANTLRTTFVEPHPKRNYVMQWNLNVQYQLTPNLTGMIAYVGSRGLHQPFRVDDADLVLPTKTSAGYLWPQVDVMGNLIAPPNAGSPPSRINENFGSVRGMFYKGRSYFDALEIQLSKRMSHGFQLQGSYTWGKSIDTNSATLAGDAFGNSVSSLHWFDPKLSRAVSDFNVGRTLVLNGTWELASPRSLSGPAAWAFSGWQLGLIFLASDGVPFTAAFAPGADPLGTLSSDDWDFPSLVGGPGCKTLTNPGNPNNYIKTQCFAVPTAPDMPFWKANCDAMPPNIGGPISPPLPALACFNLRGNAGRNILVGPGITNFDFSVFKNNYIKKISENFNVQFRLEIFNILNHANFAPPTTPDNTSIYDGTGTPTGVAGVLSKTSGSERQIQLALKIMF
jgi:outer membrane receptor protein involved in Fe transport